MRKFLVSVVALCLAASSAWAQTPPPPPGQGPGDGDNVHYGWADVLRVDPVYRVVQVQRPQQDCYQSPVVRQEGGDHTAGTVLGAVIGGVLGHTIGKGDGRRAATVLGAVAGGAVGNHVAGQNDRTYEGTETRCRDVNTVSQERRVIGYDVEYRYRGEVYLSRLDYDPGERLRVRVSVTPAD